MAEKITTLRLVVHGMTCGNCEQRIEKAVLALQGVHKVTASASLSEVMAYYDPARVGRDAICAAIRSAGYEVHGQPDGAAPAPTVAQAESSKTTSVYRFLGLIAAIAALYLIIRYTVGFTFLPAVSQSMGYGLIFVVGLLTSLHCIAMCGGIVLSQGISSAPRPGNRLMPSLLYNAGRVVSYTIIGGTVGALGSLFSLSSALKGVMPVIAGAFMLFLGVRMLGIIPWLSRLKIRIPGIAGRTPAASGRGPFVVGLLNGLMPCGPLQTMQVYALGTGSFLAGALSMFLFSLGTVPLLLGFGAISSFLSARFNRRMLKASGVLVMVLGLLMFTRGLNLFGVSLPVLPSRTGVAVATLSGGYQDVRTTVESGEYHPFVVQAGVPVRWTINAKADDLNGCNNPVTIPQYGISKRLVPGDNLVEFTPTKVGIITYTCWMGMISSSIRVVADLSQLTPSDLTGPPAGSVGSAFGPDRGRGGGCCGVTPGRFAGGKIPVGAIQVARLTGEGQVADVAVNDEGYTPAVIVVKRGVKAKIRFLAEKLSACNYIVRFPEYQGGLDLSKGQLQAVRRVVSAFTPASVAGGCCGK